MLTQEQKINRREYIGGSDISVILGLSNYKTPYELFLEKKGLLNQEEEENHFQHWGNVMEPLLKREFAQRRRVEVHVFEEAREHPLYPFLKANVDGWIPSLNAVWEGKTASQFLAHKWGHAETDAIPLDYLCQIAFYCSVMNCEDAYLSVLIGGNDYREFHYKRDRELEARIINAACDFWDKLQKNIPPPAKTRQDLSHMYPVTDNTKVKSSNEDINICLKIANEMNEKIKELEDIRDRAKFSIMTHMEDAEELVSEEGQLLCSFRKTKKGTRIFLMK